MIRRGTDLFGDLAVPVEIRDQVRVHLWYADRFGAAAPAPFRSGTEAVDGFAAVCCSVAVTVEPGGRARAYAPYGYADLFALVVRPNRRQAPREVYEAKAARWQRHWPELTVLPWDEPSGRESRRPADG